MMFVIDEAGFGISLFNYFDFL